MTKYLMIAKARKQLLGLPKELEREPIVITKHGKPIMVTISYDQMESLLETLEILQERDFSSQLATGIEQAEQGQTISWEDAKDRLGW